MSTGANTATISSQGKDWQPAKLPKVDYGQGCYIFDTDGKRYIDGSAGPAVYSLGHAHPEVNEAIKLITGEGDSLEGRLLLYDALHMDFQEVKIRWDADCPVCGKEPTITELIDYEAFCGVPAR